MEYLRYFRWRFSDTHKVTNIQKNICAANENFIYSGHCLYVCVLVTEMSDEYRAVINAHCCRNA